MLPSRRIFLLSLFVSFTTFLFRETARALRPARASGRVVEDFTVSFFFGSITWPLLSSSLLLLLFVILSVFYDDIFSFTKMVEIIACFDCVPWSSSSVRLLTQHRFFPRSKLEASQSVVRACARSTAVVSMAIFLENFRKFLCLELVARESQNGLLVIVLLSQASVIASVFGWFRVSGVVFGRSKYWDVVVLFTFRPKSRENSVAGLVFGCFL